MDDGGTVVVLVTTIRGYFRNCRTYTDIPTVVYRNTEYLIMLSPHVNNLFLNQYF